MGGNECELDAVVFLFRWMRRATVEAARGRPAAAALCALGFGAGGRRKVTGWAMWVGGAGQKAEAQWEGEGNQPVKKDWVESDGRIKFDF
jgi:hypothetical protein